MGEGRVTRRERGLAQDFANQLAQMAVGVEAMFVGAVLSGEPEVGEIRLDAATASATVGIHRNTALRGARSKEDPVSANPRILRNARSGGNSAAEPVTRVDV